MTVECAVQGARLVRTFYVAFIGMLGSFTGRT
jgi:hypothetical protein